MYSKIKLGAKFLLALAFLVFVFDLFAATSLTGRRVESYNDGWEFSRDGKTWKAVDVPHDWAIEGPFEPNGDPNTGKLPWKGVGYYRKNFVIDKPLNGRRLFFDFDGVMCDGTVFVNNQPCARQQYGYLGMCADATAYVFAGTNTILVKADTTKLSSRWYPGAGMYRRVRKIETAEVYISSKDVFVSHENVSESNATLKVEGVVISRRLDDTSAKLKMILLAPDGKEVLSLEKQLKLNECAEEKFSFSAKVKNPQLWSLGLNAKLYKVKLVLSAQDAEDEVMVRTGFRFFKFDPAGGFILNGKRVQLKGVCLHSDLGILGVAYNRSVMRRKLEKMLDMGANAIRTAHNPVSPETLDLCDEMGIFVWNECFDKWNQTTARGDEVLEDFVKTKLQEFVRRDRNHPSIFVWSIGNEIPPGGGFAPGQEIWDMPSTIGTTAERCTRFRNAIRELDTTRPVGIGSCFSEAVELGHYNNLDISGWNYGVQYRIMHRKYPHLPVLYTESASACSEYGFYADKLPTNKTDYAIASLRVDSYDRNASPWSDIPDREFEKTEVDTYMGGEFVWTGIDYLGEPTPYAHGNISHTKIPVPPGKASRSSYYGIFDLLVFPKDRAYLYRSYWNKDAFTLHIVPDHWNFEYRSEKKLPVYVYTSAPSAELFVNGVSQGVKTKNKKASLRYGYYGGMPRYRLIWNNVEWQKGEIKAVALDESGKRLGEKVLKTAMQPARVVLESESKVLSQNIEEFLYIKVTLEDRFGVKVPRDNRRINFKIEGNAKIVAVGNSDPHGYDSFKEVASHPLFGGRAGLVIRRTAPGEVVLTASAEGVEPSTIYFK